VLSAEEHLTSSDSVVVATWKQVCVSRPNDLRPVVADLEYMGWVEEILEVNYGVQNIVVLLCN